MTYSTRRPEPPANGKPAPGFTTRDTAGKPRRLREWRGRPVVLFFFCGCSWCTDVAKEWATYQRTRALPDAPPTPAGKSNAGAITVVVYQGSAEEAIALQRATNLDPARTVLLPDPDNRLTTLYGADPCPRAIVLDPTGVVRYANRGPDDLPRKSPAPLIAGRTLNAARAPH